MIVCCDSVATCCEEGTSLPSGGIEGGLLILHIHRIPFQDIGDLMGSEGYFSLHEFRDVITAHELAVIVGVGSRQLERLGAFSVGIYMGNERTGIGTVVSAAADDDPSAVARPGVITGLISPLCRSSDQMSASWCQMWK